MQRKILIIEDENFQLALYSRILHSEGYTVLGAETLKKARDIFKNNQIEVCIVDVRLPDGNGVEFVSEIREKSPGTEVIVFTSYGVISDGVTAIKNGAFDYIVKGEAAEKLIRLVDQAMQLIEKREQTSNLLNDQNKGFDAIIGTSAAIKRIKAMGQKVANTSANVLLLGETGVGKDVFAEAVHFGSNRANNPFVAINCSSIGQEMLESELFGYKAGAFTGATTNKKGLFEEAHNGTIFLDEIGEMSLNLQARILRVLENKSFIKLGDTKTTYIDSRLIAATHVDLLAAVKEGRFREDLYYRISSFTIKIPPLRERGSDIRLLLHHYVKKLAIQMKVTEPNVTEPFIYRSIGEIFVERKRAGAH
jgi:two-component system NtrC family response regulator